MIRADHVFVPTPSISSEQPRQGLGKRDAPSQKSGLGGQSSRLDWQIVTWPQWLRYPTPSDLAAWSVYVDSASQQADNSELTIFLPRLTIGLNPLGLGISRTADTPNGPWCAKCRSFYEVIRYFTAVVRGQRVTYAVQLL